MTGGNTFTAALYWTDYAVINSTFKTSNKGYWTKIRLEQITIHKLHKTFECQIEKYES